MTNAFSTGEKAMGRDLLQGKQGRLSEGLALILKIPKRPRAKLWGKHTPGKETSK